VTPSKVINVQPIEKREEPHPDGSLDVHSIFPTIQGEGPFVGQPAVFLRLAGCNLQCPLCDTEYTQGRLRLSVPVIFDSILDHAPPGGYRPLIVITGGEPLRQDIGPLVRFMIDKGYRVQIETNGSLYRDLPYMSGVLTIVCSPKSGKLNPDMVKRIDYYKYVVKAGDVDVYDGLPTHALDHPVARKVARPPEGFYRDRVYIQPADTQDAAENQSHLQAAIWSARHFGYTLCIQTHKIINLP
jgi:organic radical activating enzyme